MLKLYCFPRSGNSREVKIVLAEKMIPFEPINVHGDKSVKESPEFKKASPKGTVPAIIDGDVFMSEAFEINQYLDRKYPKPQLMPDDVVQRKAICDWVAVHDKRLVLKIGFLVIECILKPKEQQKEETKSLLRADITEGMREVDQFLSGKEYLFGEYSLADASITPHLAALPILGMSIPEDFRNLTAWFKRIQARPSFQQSLQ